MRKTPEPHAKAKAKAKGKAKVKAAARKSTPKDISDISSLGKEAQVLCKELFQLSDQNTDGTIGFSEFLHHHTSIMHHNHGSKLGEYTRPDQFDKTFRMHDEDNSGGLDMREFLSYMEAVFSVVGKVGFQDLCQDLIQETIKKNAERAAGFDRTFSERLIEQARNANSYKPQMQEMAFRFLDSKADPNYVDNTGSNMLLYAADKVHSDEVFIMKLLERNADPTIHNKDAECAAFRAARVRDVDVLKVLMLPDAFRAFQGGGSNHVDNLSAQFEASNKLVTSIGSCSAHEVRELLNKKANVNHRHENGWTPLTAAVFWGRRDNLEVLLSTATRTSLGSSGVLHLDVRNGKGRSALHIAARKGSADLIPMLLKVRADPDQQDTDGWTALHHAVFNGKGGCVQELLNGSATLVLQGKNGLTPFMVTKMPEAAGRLSDGVAKQLEPKEAISYNKGMLHILKDDTLSVFGKLQALLDAAHSQSAQQLRMYEQFFDPKNGPNKVRLQKTLEVLAIPLLKTMASGDVELEPPGPHMAEEAARERKVEIEARRKQARLFLHQWFLDSKGLRHTNTYKHDNRGSYKAELDQAVRAELAKFKVDFDSMYSKLQDLDGGAVLCAQLPKDVINSKGTSQLGVHPFPIWLENFDPGAAFEALRLVGASDMGKDDDSSIMQFIDMIANGEDFFQGAEFWKNVYKLWLYHYCKLVDSEFQRKVKSLVDEHNSKHSEPHMEVSYKAGPLKTYSRMKAKERTLGAPTHETYEGRTVASKILDINRCQITVRSPQAAVDLLNKFKSLELIKDKMELAQSVNRWNEGADTLEGYRDLELNVIFNGGPRPAACGRQGKQIQLSIVGEVKIALQDFVDLAERRSTLFDYTRGFYDWAPDDVCPGSGQAQLQEDEFVEHEEE